MAILDTDTAKRFYDIAAENKRREGEALRLWRPMPTQLPFLMSDATERIVRGGNRGGKTILASAEVASAATGIPLIGLDGKELPYRYPKRPLTIWIIGFDQKHIARIYKFLFTAGIFEKFRNVRGLDVLPTRFSRKLFGQGACLFATFIDLCKFTLTALTARSEIRAANSVSKLSHQAHLMASDTLAVGFHGHDFRL